MSEFVECQNCGRRFFAENLDCPYCGGRDEDDENAMVTDLMRTVAPSTPAAPPQARAGLFDVLFAGFIAIAVVFGAWAIVLFARAASPGARVALAAEAMFAAVAVAGVVRQRRWARTAAIAFIACNTALGLASLAVSGLRPFVTWGPGSAGLLLFAWPFFSPQARARFSR